MTTSVVPHGLSLAAYWGRVGGRIARDQPRTSSMSAAARRLALQILDRRRRRFAKTCGKGHRWTPTNTYVAVRRTGKQAGQQVRICKACQLIATGRRRWSRIAAGKIQQLRLAMITAHPDRGGSKTRFIKARAEYLRAKSTALAASAGKVA